jgi:hypothetical protein
LGQSFNDNLVAPTNNNMPVAKYLATWQSCMWLGWTFESGVEHPNRIRFSHPGSAGDWRSFDYIDIDPGADGDYITGLIALQDRLLVFKRKSIYVLAGSGPDAFQVFPLSREHGAVSQDAIVNTDLGVYFFSWSDGVMLYDGNKVQWQFEKMLPLIDGGLIPEAAQNLPTLGWSNRRLWVGIPYRPNVDAPVPTANTRTLVLDPSLTKEGSWVMYDIPSGPMFDMKLTELRDNLLSSITGNTRILILESPGVTSPTDNYGGGPIPIASWYRTRWVDLGQPAVVKRWRTPEFVIRAIDAETDIEVDVFRDYDATSVRRTFSVNTSISDSVMEWGDPWGELWERDEGETGGNEVVRGKPFGQARAVQLRFRGPINHLWGLNQISLKYTPKKLRAG